MFLEGLCDRHRACSRCCTAVRLAVRCGGAALICVYLATSPAMADRLGCFAATQLENRPVTSLSLYVFQNASRQGRYAAIQADGTETLAPCPTNGLCIAPGEGGSLAIEATGDGIKVITDRFAFGNVDLGNGSLWPERYALHPADIQACGGTA